MLKHHFAEGITVVGDKLLQITWKEHELIEYELPSLKMLRTLPLGEPREGWGLAGDGQRLYATDGNKWLYHLDPTTYERTAKLEITDDRLRVADRWLPRSAAGLPIYGVNELEMVGAELWGNVYPMYQGKASECIVRLDPNTGSVLGWVDMRGLRARQRAEVQKQPHNFVLNGIAYHEASDRLYVTGKQWDRLYQVRIKPNPQAGPKEVLEACNLGVVPSGSEGRTRGLEDSSV